MPDITLPEIKLPEVKLPDGLRDMSRQDIQHAIGNVKPPKLDLPKKIEMPDIDLSKIELPKAIEDRLPGRRRTNPVLPIAGLLVIGSLIAATWWLITTPGATMRVREAADRLRYRITGKRTDMVRYDDDGDLTSLLGQQDPSYRPADETWTSPDAGVPVGPGTASETSPIR